MPKGTPLSPEVAELIAELYVQTGNLSETARQLNLPFETVRDVIAKGSNARRRQLHERAIDEGLERAREHLTETLDLVGQEYLKQLRSGSIEPNHIRDLMTSLAAGNRALISQKLLRLKSQQSRLTRQRTRLETQLLDREVQKGGGSKPTIIGPDDPGWADLQREVFGSPRQGLSDAKRGSKGPAK